MQALPMRFCQKKYRSEGKCDDEQCGGGGAVEILQAGLSVNMGGQRVEIEGAQQKGGGQFFDRIHKDKHHSRCQAPPHKRLIYV